MAKVNSNSITALGEKNKLLSEANEKKIAALKKLDTEQKNDITNLKSEEKIDNSKLTNKLSTEDSDIKKVESVNKDQNSALTKLTNE